MEIVRLQRGPDQPIAHKINPVIVHSYPIMAFIHSLLVSSFLPHQYRRVDEGVPMALSQEVARRGRSCASNGASESGHLPESTMAGSQVLLLVGAEKIRKRRFSGEVE